MPPGVAIIVVNWNGRRLLETCLPAALAQTYANYEVVVVDNGSQDGSPDWIASAYPQISLIRNQTNAGFCAANNRAIAATSTPYVALLNNDAAPQPGWLDEMVRAAESDPHIGSCAPRILRWDDHALVDSLGLAVDRSGTFWELGSGTRDRAAAPRQAGEVFGASGAACLYRRAMLDDVGLLDDDYFAYLEDADLAWRARLAGWRCLYVPEAVVYHRHSATASEGSPLKGYHLGRNKWWTIVKDYPSPDLLWNLPVILGRDLLAAGYHLVVRRDVHPLRGRLAALRSLGDALRKRRLVQQRATAAGKQSARRLRRPLRWR